MDNDPRGTLIQQGDIMRVNRALVEDVACFGAASGYLLIS